MNAKTAKALRRAVGFNVHAERRYKHAGRRGTITSTGDRAQYQAIKRGSRMVLAAVLQGVI
ncbi:hypothetical protein [Aquabacterium sp.]|uniref:hypothetical protein n=1 Tax=Aquabacterium sp. TaxID=1872578 RepID=UPI00248A4884|nr:hypothetical protein [Aquabacterium sp.]MDI1347913.1 hypothetical protein [Aquabacterium sp.]